MHGDLLINSYHLPIKTNKIYVLMHICSDFQNHSCMWIVKGKYKNKIHLKIYEWQWQVLFYDNILKMMPLPVILKVSTELFVLNIMLHLDSSRVFLSKALLPSVYQSFSKYCNFKKIQFAPFSSNIHNSQLVHF